MEDDHNNNNNSNNNKKKKNKKKKNKTAEALYVATAASASGHQKIPNGFDQNHRLTNAFQAAAAAQTPKPSEDSVGHGPTASDVGLEEKIKQLETERVFWALKEARPSTEEQIKQLQMQKEEYMNKEIELELKFSKLHNEKEYWLQKEAILEENIKQLQMEKEEYMYKEADLGLIISKLQTEKDSLLHREADLGLIISKLQTEKDYLLHREVGLEEKIKQLETERVFWALKENSTTETIAGLNADNTRLYSQVMELEESRRNILQENQQLLENISGLQSQIQNSAHLSGEIKEMENRDIKSEMLVAQTMVEKLLLENAELVEKLNAEHDRRGTMAELSSSVCSGPMASTMEAGHGDNSALELDPIAGTSERLAGEVVAVASSEDQSLLEEKMKPVENEIVQIPLEENEASGINLQAEDSSSVETSVVPISDAPLVGAPFRFISFVARYVSGADLVSQSP